MVRKPAQAGRFYMKEPEALRSQVEKYIRRDIKKEDVLGIMAPHAGYLYSGKVAGAVYSKINLPDTIIIIGPNHTGIGAEIAIMSEGEWEMPNGRVEIDSSLAKELLSEAGDLAQEDKEAHLREHSLEVQLPFIQYFKTDFTIVPICMRDQRVSTCRELGKAIARVIKSKTPCLIVASSDMTHRESQKDAERKDRLAIDKILKLDAEGLLKTVIDEDISMCGPGPTATMIFACKELGAKRSELVLYNTSAEATGDYSAVVGYAGIIVK
ncbi:AmmeMemoRadiSam system protein B [bacterium]|nr:AmmeMemoRadiSam system protein B [bacterium]